MRLHPKTLRAVALGASLAALSCRDAFVPDYDNPSLAQAIAEGVEGSPFSAQEQAAARGFARTFQALEYLRLIESRDTLGVPIVSGRGTLDPVRCKPAVLQYVVALLDSGATDLAAGGA